MKEYDRVKLINERAEYQKLGIYKGDKGIVLGEERSGYILVYFDGIIFQNSEGVFCTTEIDAGIRAEDLELIGE